jgi:hypothetical protein
VDPVLGGEVVEGEQLVELAGDLGDRLGVAGEGVSERLDRAEGVGAGGGTVDGSDLGLGV